VTLHLDDRRMRAPHIASGVTDAEWAALAARFREVHQTVHGAAGRARFGFLDLETQRAEHDRVRAFSAGARAAMDDVVLLGIGGSALGAAMLRTALAGAAPAPRLHVLDNVDPATMSALLPRLVLQRTLWLVVSKSGTTVETLAQYAIARSAVEAAGLPLKGHFAFVTDPAAGPLRAAAARDGIPAFEIPPNVGGRYSVLTPVGTLPASLLGADTTALLDGARAMRDRCASDALDGNPAGAYAALQWRAHQRSGQGVHVLMPYSDALRDVAPWFVQLWAESLGKRDADGINVGPTPLGARGATDQHSLLQLLMEGPADKTVTFVAVRGHPGDLTIPPRPDLPPDAAHLGGRTLGQLLDAERVATAEALAAQGRPSLTITLDTGDASHVGELLMFLMLATVYAGALYRVDPLDQPGVELGKRLAREALLRRPSGAHS